MVTDKKIQKVIGEAFRLDVPSWRVEAELSAAPHLLTADEIKQAMERYATPESVTILAPRKARVNREVNAKTPERNHTPSKLNRSSVKEFALEVSDAKKAGKFERVSGDFVKWAEAELENIIQGICRNPHSDDDLQSSNQEFLNWKQVGPRVREVLNRAVRRAIFSRVKNHPSTGKTLK